MLIDQVDAPNGDVIQLVEIDTSELRKAPSLFRKALSSQVYVVLRIRADGSFKTCFDTPSRALATSYFNSYKEIKVESNVGSNMS